jgi:small GTP-binding protein
MYMGKGFTSNYLATIGADFSFAQYESEGKVTKFSIWDIAGEQNYSSIRSQFYSGTAGVIIVFDITRVETFYQIDHWVAELKASMIGDVAFVLVGNKDDLREFEGNVVSEEEINQRLAMWEQIMGVKIPLFYASALSGLNVKEIFAHVMDSIL